MKKLMFAISLFCAGATSAYAEIRNALVIGNGSYQQIGALSNPTNDAVLMSTTLRELGFNVIESIDASQIEMKRAVRNFGTALNAAGREGIGLFYYAGHGVQVNGANYIIPIDAVIDKEGDVDIEAINANSVLSMMEFSNSRLNFVILDACRNNPYSRGFRSATRGLAKMNAPTGTMIAYATSPGEVAVDGDGENSPYTTSLVAAMNQTGVPIEKMFRTVRNDVRALTNNKQTPWESSSLIGDDFYFKTMVEVANTAEGQEITVTTEAVRKNQTDADAEAHGEVAASALQPVVIKNNNIELLFWESVKDSSNPAVLQAYINRYPNGIFVELAELKIDSVRSQTKASAQTPVTKVVVEAASKAERKSAKTVQPTASVADSLRGKLNECESHFKANRLTTGSVGNALDCYSEVLAREPGNAIAMRGLVKIERRYADWARRDISQGSIKNATRNINKLRSVNEDNTDLIQLETSLDALIAQQQALAQPAIAEPVTLVASTETQIQTQTQVPTQTKSPTDPLADCERYLHSGQLLGRGKKNALACYQDALEQDPANSAAQIGIARIEDALFDEFTYNIYKEKSLIMAKSNLRDMRRVNVNSKHMRKMQYLYKELKMEMRW